MSNTTKTAASRVEVSVPRGPERGDPNVFIGINGMSYLLPRGKKSSVPPEVAHELERAERARERLDETMDALQRAGA